MKLLTTPEIIAKYGQPGDESNLGTIALPYPMKLAWDPHITVYRMRCHRMIAERLIKVFNAIHLHYGLSEIQKLGIDLYGGCYANRPMRGGTEPSRHSWGIALDISPEKNGLHTSWTNAQFSRPEYKKFVEAFYLHGFLNLGLERNIDAMHFETSI